MLLRDTGEGLLLESNKDCRLREADFSFLAGSFRLSRRVRTSRSTSSTERAGGPGLSAIEDQISENLHEDLPALPTDSFRASKDVNISAWFRILCRMVLGWIVMLLECALSMSCLVMFVSMMSGWSRHKIEYFFAKWSIRLTRSILWRRKSERE